MAIRFTEYLTHEDREIPLYIVQEDIDLDKIGFKIFIREENNAPFALYKVAGEPWQLIPQNVSQIVKSIEPQLINLLEEKLADSQRYEPLVRRVK